MRNYISNCKSSIAEFKNTKSITLMALLTAMSIAVSSFRIIVSPSLHIGFSTLVNQYAYSLIGPVAGAIYGGVLDIIKAMIMPTGKFDLLYTISPVIAGFIYGSFYYRRKITVLNALLANFFVKLICNVIITTAIMAFTGGKAMLVLLPVRAIKNLIQWPVDSILFFGLAGLLNKIKDRI